MIQGLEEFDKEDLQICVAALNALIEHALMVLEEDVGSLDVAPVAGAVQILQQRRSFTYPGEVMAAESDLERWCKDAAKARGCRLRKHVSPGDSGWPDRDLLVPRQVARLLHPRVIFVEFKAPDGKTRKLQDAKIAWLRGAGFEVHVINDKYDFLALLDKHAMADETTA